MVYSLQGLEKRVRVARYVKDRVELPDEAEVWDFVKIEGASIELNADNGEILVGESAVLRSRELSTVADSLAVVRVQLTEEGDLEVSDESGRLVLDEVEVLNGNVTVTTTGDLEAREIVLLNDWDGSSSEEGAGAAAPSLIPLVYPHPPSPHPRLLTRAA